MQFKWNRDCKSFPGVWACDILKSEGYKSCEDCNFYEPTSKRILIIKLGALGDVLRTIPVVKAIKKKYGNDTNITWLVREESIDLLKGCNELDRILAYNLESILKLKSERFDVLFSLEIDPPGIAIASTIDAREKFGYYLNREGHPDVFNKKAEYYLERAWSDYINRKNRKTYQEMIFEVAELPYSKERYNIKSKEETYSENFKKINNIQQGDKLIGINVGSAGRWPSKAWHEDRIIDLVKKLSDASYKVILLGGLEEVDKLPRIIYNLEENGIKVIKNDQNNTLNQFISIVDLCDIVVTGDSLALHIAIGLNKKIIALFFCTPPWEIEGYETVYKIVSPLLERYFFTDIYIEDLVKSISYEEVIKIIKELDK